MTGKGTDWAALGLKVGLEIHQQLDTSKLFCECPSELEEEDGPEVVRRLRPTQSEMGEIDKASLIEARRHLQFVYQNPPGSCCLVEIDEEPPHDIDPDALMASFMMSKLLKAWVVDEIHVMRKMVIDGSNPTGFQRTALVAIDGCISTRIGEVPIELIGLEEDAARRVGTRPGQAVFKLDRLGIPLIEVATGPVMHEPDQVRDVAETIGQALRATKMVKRGIGTIRQDLNVSIARGRRVEIKGVQELNAISGIVADEAKRQLALVHIMDELARRGYDKGHWEAEPVDITDILKDCGSRIVKKALKEKGGVIGVRLPGFKGLLDREKDGTDEDPDERGPLKLGRELAAHARTAGPKGIFHSDELPGMGFTQEDVDAVAKALDALEEHDAFALVAGRKKRALAAIHQVIERARMAFDGVPEEVRGVREEEEDGPITEFQRPMAGAARMYPETDIPPVRVLEEHLEKVVPPELPKDRVARFMQAYGLSREQALQLVHRDLDDIYEDLCKDLPKLSSVVARTLLNTLPELEDMGVRIEDLGILRPILEALARGGLAKEGIPDVLRVMVEKGARLTQALEELGLSGGPDLDEVRKSIRGLVREKGDLVKDRGMGAMGPLMGEVMDRFRGKADGKVLSDILKQEIKAFLEPSR